MVDPKIINHPHGDRTFTSTLYYGADVRESLRKLPDQSVQCIMTGPPYWGLRVYLREDDPLNGQEIGREDTPERFVQELVDVFREARRVLRDDGVMWMNLGDSYAGSGAVASKGGSKQTNTGSGGTWAGGSLITQKRHHPPSGLKPKDLVGIPWRVALALQADGWWLRSDVVWSKPNPMPESVTDRPGHSHEYVFLLSKSERYYYDANAVKVVSSEGTRHLRSVWTINVPKYRGAHFATMPPKLVEVCVKAGSRPGDTVLDCFSGSGTTGYVANRLGRHYIGTDLNIDYLPLAEARLMGRDPPEEEDEATEGEVSVLDLL